MNQDFRLKEITGIYENTIHHFEWSNGSYDRGTKAFLLDSFAFFPLISRDSFFATRKFQSDYMKVKTGSVKAGPFDIDTYLRDTVANIGTVYVNDGSLSSFRDKRLPFKSGVVKRLPAAWLRKFPLRMSVDSVFFKNGHVEYTELNDKTGKAGTVIVSRMDASLFPVRNYGQQKADSLQIQATGYLMDSVLTRLCVKQSMTDTSGGLLLTGQISPADARLLNPVLIPLASVKLESGFLDTMTMTVTATESVATGEMKMFYHDLKIKFLNNQNEKKKTTYKGFASFLANTFVVKNNNRSRTGTVYFERIRERSPFHYLVKITISGVSSTVGIKNNKRLLREYKKALAKRNLASINHD
jgi:hypothetical protein